MDSIEFIILKHIPPISALKEQATADLLNIDQGMYELFLRGKGIEAFLGALQKFSSNSDMRAKYEYFETKYFIIEPDDLENVFY